MNKKNLIQNYGLWLLLLLAYAGFIFLKNFAWIEDKNITTSDLLTTLEGKMEVPPENPDNTAFTEKIPAEATDTIPIPSKNPDSAPKPTSSKTTPFKPKTPYQPAPIDINTATPEEWETLRGIGHYRSGMIVRFRTALGGFHSIDQVSETYALPDSVFKEIRPFLQMKTPPKKLYINSLPYDDLYKHPYITKQMAYFIARHRENQGFFENMLRIYEITEEKDHERLKKLEPYVDFSIR